MTLLEAFRRIAPLVGEPATDRDRSEAARVIHAALRAFAASTPLLRRAPPHDRDEAVAIVLLRLVQAGPRATRWGDPEDDVSVDRYLRAALHNAALDRARSVSRRAELPLDPTDRPPDSSPSADDLVDLSRAARTLQTAFEDLWSVLLPVATAGRRAAAAARLREAVRELVELFDGHTTVERLVAIAAPNSSPENSRKARYALYQRHHRALSSLFEAFESVQTRPGLPPARVEALRAVLHGLRLGSVPRATKENS